MNEPPSRDGRAVLPVALRAGWVGSAGEPRPRTDPRNRDPWCFGASGRRPVWGWPSLRRVMMKLLFVAGLGVVLAVAGCDSKPAAPPPQGPPTVVVTQVVQRD